jgi:hypothetical protein
MRSRSILPSCQEKSDQQVSLAVTVNVGQLRENPSVAA